MNMAGSRQTEQTRGAWRCKSLLHWSVLTLGALTLSGCMHASPTSTSQPKQDPLFGVTPPGNLPPAANPGPAPGPPSQPQAFNPGGVPAIPKELSTTNMASVAGTSSPSSLGRPLAINDQITPARAGTPGQLTTDTKPQQTPVQPGFPAANLNPRVEQVPDVKPAGSWQTPQGATQAVQTAHAAPAVTAETLSRQLQERGVLNQKQDAVPEGIRLTCYVSRNGGAGLRVYEATASDYSAAAQAILKQLDAPPP